MADKYHSGLKDLSSNHDNFSGDAEFAFGDDDGRVLFIFRFERHHAVFFVKPFFKFFSRQLSYRLMVPTAKNITIELLRIGWLAR